MARYSNPIIQYSDGNGVPLPGATLDFFEPGTTTPKNTYSDSGLTTPNTNPVVADSDGVMPDIWLDGTYAVVLKNAEGVIQPEGTKDPIGETTAGQWEAWLNDNTYNIPDLVKGSDNKFYRSLTDANQGNDPTSSASDWEEIEFERIYNATVTYALGDRSIGSDGMLYFSLIASNLNNNPVTQTASTNWRAADQARSADDTGAADALIATFIPAVAAYKNGLEVRVRALFANATTTPTINYNGLGAKTIVKNGNQALSVNDIAAPGHELQLVYNLANDNIELMNPASSLVVFTESFESTVQVITSGGALVLAHGLGVEPRIVQFFLECTSAEDGYSIGDIIGAEFNSTLTALNRYSSSKIDATNITVRYSNATNVFVTCVASTGAAAPLTNTNWRLLARAYA